MPDRSDALGLLGAWVENPGLRNHMLAVEAAVRHYARMFQADEDLWGLAGLLQTWIGSDIPTVIPWRR